MFGRRNKIPKPSDQQKLVLETVRNWDPSETDIIVVSGEAGSGKTTLINSLYLNSQNPRHDFRNIIVGTLTGRAATLLREMGVLKARTIASLVFNWEADIGGGQEQWTQKPGNPPEDQIGRKNLLIFDESSMIPDGIDVNESNYKVLHKGAAKTTLEYIEDYWKALGDKTLLIFVGDQHQLGPPVKTKEDPNERPFSFAINQTAWERRGQKVVHVDLGRTHRQKEDSNIINLARGLVDLKLNSEGEFIEDCDYYGKPVEGEDQDGLDWKHFCNLADYEQGKGVFTTEEPVETFLELYSNSNPTTLLLSFSNKKNYERNVAIRRKIFDLDAIKFLESDNLEKQEAIKNCNIKTEYELDIEDFKRIYTDYIKDIIPLKNDIIMITKNNRFDPKNHYMNGDYVKVSNNPEEELVMLPILSINNPNPEHKDEWFGMKKIPYTLTISTLIIEEISTLETTGQTLSSPAERKFIVESLAENNGYTESERKILQDRIDRYLIQYINYEFERIYGKQNLPTQEARYMRNKLRRDSDVYNALRGNYGYSVTAHKAQGGQWENVIVDFESQRSHSNQWAYTAITRAKSTLYLYKYPGKEVKKMKEINNPVAAGKEYLTRFLKPLRDVLRDEEGED